MKSAPMIKRILHFLLTVFVLLLPCLAFAEEPIATPTDPACGTTEFEAGEIIIEFKEGIPQTSVQSLNQITSFRLQNPSQSSPITVFVPQMSFPMIRVISLSGASPKLKLPPLGTSPLAATR